jgi:aspartate/methionine/tyrosine aminotransferase
MTLLRSEIERLRQNGITRVAVPRLGDPAVIPLWFGEGDAVTADAIREAAKTALDEGKTFYCNSRGRPELRQAIQSYLRRIYAIEVDPARITVPGSTMLGITIAAQMALTTGSHGLIVGPAWPNIYSAFKITGADVSYVRQQERNGRWALDMPALLAEIRDNTRAIFVNTPCNPTGWVMTQAEQIRLLEVCRERDVLIIADEVYHRNVYDGEVAPSFLSIADADDPVISVNGFSKAWAMTGWRLGWMVTPRRYAEQMAVLSECFNTGASSFVQVAGVTALEEGEAVLATLRETYRRGRETVMEALGSDPRIQLLRPEGAFYAFPRIPGLRSSLQFSEDLLAKENVGVAPGYTFGPGNEDHFRLCFAQSHDRLEEALRRILRFLDHHIDSLREIESAAGAPTERN